MTTGRSITGQLAVQVVEIDDEGIDPLSGEGEAKVGAVETGDLGY